MFCFALFYFSLLYFYFYFYLHFRFFICFVFHSFPSPLSFRAFSSSSSPPLLSLSSPFHYNYFLSSLLFFSTLSLVSAPVSVLITSLLLPLFNLLLSFIPGVEVDIKTEPLIPGPAETIFLTQGMYRQHA